MARDTHDPVQLTSTIHGKRGARVLTVYIEADNRFQIEDSGFGLANVYAHKKGYAAYGDKAQVTVGQIVQSQWSGRWQCKVEYTARWR
jgi:hypothetical protein